MDEWTSGRVDEWKHNVHRALLSITAQNGNHVKTFEELGSKALYRLGYPNREVRQSLNEHLLRHLVQDAERQTANSMRLARGCWRRTTARR